MVNWVLKTGLLAIWPGLALAVGPDEEISDPVVPFCTDGMVLSGPSCVTARGSGLADDNLMRQARGYAAQEDFSSAQIVLRAVKIQSDTHVQTLWGYVYRQTGQLELGLKHYEKALALDPNNNLARAYLGAAFVQMKDYDRALHQMAEIQNRGGRGSHAEDYLRAAILGNPAQKYQTGS